jgi:hypothetical protein
MHARFFWNVETNTTTYAVPESYVPHNLASTGLLKSHTMPPWKSMPPPLEACQKPAEGAMKAA